MWLRILGCILLVIQVFIIAHFYSQVWGLIGWVVGVIFFIPLTLLSLFGNLIHGNFSEFILGIMWLAFIGTLITQGDNN